MQQPSGAALLRQYLSRHKLVMTRWCVSKGLPRTAITRILAGTRQSVSLATAFAIERATDGEVPARSWAEVQP